MHEQLIYLILNGPSKGGFPVSHWQNLVGVSHSKFGPQREMSLLCQHRSPSPAQGYHLPNCNPLESPGLSQRNLGTFRRTSKTTRYIQCVRLVHCSGKTVSTRARVIN